jgi:hypothetical protein
MYRKQNETDVSPSIEMRSATFALRSEFPAMELNPVKIGGKGHAIPNPHSM